jgi:phenylacetic acid degradation operon negative regulatory protein
VSPVDGVLEIPADGREPAQGSAPSLLLTLLGELVLPAGQPVRTAALIYVLTGMGVTEPTARTTVARAAGAGWIDGEKHGRETQWTLSASGRRLITEITERVVSLTTPAEHWDGNGIFLYVQLPQALKRVRKRLYSALGWAGFGNPAPGLWTSPHTDRADELSTIIDQLNLREFTVVAIGQLAAMGLTAPEIIARAWNLEDIAARYTQLLHTYETLEPEPGDPQLFSYLALVDEWRKFPAIDPQLPRDVLPEWIGRHASDTFSRLSRQWGPAARDRWAELTEQ